MTNHCFDLAFSPIRILLLSLILNVGLVDFSAQSIKVIIDVLLECVIGHGILKCWDTFILLFATVTVFVNPNSRSDVNDSEKVGCWDSVDIPTGQSETMVRCCNGSRFDDRWTGIVCGIVSCISCELKWTPPWGSNFVSGWTGNRFDERSTGNEGNVDGRQNDPKKLARFMNVDGSIKKLSGVWNCNGGSVIESWSKTTNSVDPSCTLSFVSHRNNRRDSAESETRNLFR